MNRCIILIFCLAFSLSAESPASVKAEIGARISDANDITKITSVYRNYRGDNNKRRIALQKIDSVFHANKTFYVNKEMQDEIAMDLQSAEPQLVYQATMTSGNLKVKGVKKSIIRNFMDADKISAGHASGIRQASMVALEQINDTTLAQVYLQLVVDRKDFWYDGDLLMALRGLSAYGDKTSFDAVKELNDRFEGYLAASGDEFGYNRKSQIAEMLDITQRILKKVGDK